MASHQEARIGEHRAIIRHGLCLFAGDSLSNAKPIPIEDREEHALGVALITYLISTGINKFKEQGEAGVTKELTQMHVMNVFCPVIQESLSMKERNKALALLTFLKEKHDMSVKAQICANGQGHSNWEKNNTTLPTVSTESVFIRVKINANEGCDVVCFDNPGRLVFILCGTLLYRTFPKIIFLMSYRTVRYN
jgi:hypothetical protein